MSYDLTRFIRFATDPIICALLFPGMDGYWTAVGHFLHAIIP